MQTNADPHQSNPSQRTALVIGASRGLGLGLVQEFISRGWRVIATTRAASLGTQLPKLAQAHPDQLRIESLEVTRPEEIARLRSSLDRTRLDVVLVNAGISNGSNETIGAVSADVFNQVMETNALAPMRIVEACAALVVPDGVIAVMSSYMGSVTLNTTGGTEVYRASKAALNSLLRSFAARHTGRQALVALHPGWVRTDMGGERAPLDVETSVKGCVYVLESQIGQPGTRFLNYKGETLAW